MRKVPTSRAPDCTVDKYIGSAFDEVKIVADNIDDVKSAATVVGDISAIVPNLDNIKNCSDNMAAIVAAPTEAANAAQSASEANTAKVAAVAAKDESEIIKQDVTAIQSNIVTIQSDVTTKQSDVAAKTTLVDGYKNEAEASKVAAKASETSAAQSAQDALYNANLTFISGGIFSLVPVTQEYPDVSGIVRDTIWIVKLPTDGSVPVDGQGVPYYTFTTGDLAGKLVKNGWMIFYNTPQNKFQNPIVTSFTGILSVNNKTGTAITLNAADVQAVSYDSMTGAASLPSGTLLERPSSPTGGELRFNSETKEFEGFNTVEWGAIGGGGVSAYLLRNNVDFSVEKKKAYLLNVSGGANHTVTIPSGMSNDDWFEVSITGMTLEGQLVDFNFGSEVLTNGVDDYDSLRITSPMTLGFSKNNGKWYVVKATATGDYGNLEKRIEVSQQIMHVAEQKAYGTNGGAAVAGTQTRTLNTVYFNTVEGATLVGNVITLPAGVYKVYATAPAYSVNRHVIALVDNNTGTHLLDGINAYAPVADPSQSNSVVRGILQLQTETGIRVIHDIQTAKSDNGLGVGTNALDFPSIFTTVFLERVS